MCYAVDTRRGLKHGHTTTPIPKAARPSQRKGTLSAKTKLVRSIVREVAGFSAYERRVMELLRNSKVWTHAGEESRVSADPLYLACRTKKPVNSQKSGYVPLLARGCRDQSC
jgi:large subunit ribosomal protein L36e